MDLKFLIELKFFTDNYDHPIYESGIQLIDMVYLKKISKDFENNPY